MSKHVYDVFTVIAKIYVYYVFSHTTTSMADDTHPVYTFCISMYRGNPIGDVVVEEEPAFGEM